MRSAEDPRFGFEAVGHGVRLALGWSQHWRARSARTCSVVWSSRWPMCASPARTAAWWWQGVPVWGVGRRSRLLDLPPRGPWRRFLDPVVRLHPLPEPADPATSSSSTPAATPASSTASRCRSHHWAAMAATAAGSSVVRRARAAGLSSHPLVAATVHRWQQHPRHGVGAVAGHVGPVRAGGHRGPPQSACRGTVGGRAQRSREQSRPTSTSASEPMSTVKGHFHMDPRAPPCARCCWSGPSPAAHVARPRPAAGRGARRYGRDARASGATRSSATGDEDGRLASRSRIHRRVSTGVLEDGDPVRGLRPGRGGRGGKGPGEVVRQHPSRSPPLGARSAPVACSGLGLRTRATPLRSPAPGRPALDGSAAVPRPVGAACSTFVRSRSTSARSDSSACRASTPLALRQVHALVGGHAHPLVCRVGIMRLAMVCARLHAVHGGSLRRPCWVYPAAVHGGWGAASDSSSYGRRAAGAAARG